MAAADLTAARLRELLNYDPETGIFTWRRSRHGVFAGAVAGAPGRQGYILFQLEGLTRQAHRLAWLYVYGKWPEHNIDHINGTRHDNRIANLRDVPQAINAQNQRKAMSNNKSGLLGVSKNGRYWAATIRIGGKTFHLGVHRKPEDAHAVYLTAKRLIHEGNTL